MNHIPNLNNPSEGDVIHAIQMITADGQLELCTEYIQEELKEIRPMFKDGATLYQILNVLWDRVQ